MENFKAFNKLKSVTSFLNNKAKSNSHAYMLVGADHKTLEYSAIYLALNFVCKEDKPCLNCSNCVKVINNSSVDVFTYPKPKRKNILVEDIKEILDNVQSRPLDFDTKIFILNNFENATLASQNKLLKTLEEPPKDVIFILTATSEKLVLPTINSRTQTVFMPLANTEEIKEVLNTFAVEEKKLAIASENSGGRLGRAIEILNNNAYFEVYENSLDLILNMRTSRDLTKYSSKIVKNQKFLNVYFEVLENLYRDLLLIKSGTVSLIKNKNSLNLLEVASGNYSKKALIKTLEKVEQSKQKIKYNTNKTGVIDTLLLGILEVKHLWK